MNSTIRTHLIIILIFLVSAASFNAPVFSGKSIAQNDIKQYRGSAREVFDYREQEGRQILWTNVMFAGMPTYVISAVYGGELLKFIPRTINSILQPEIGFIFLLMLSFYILTQALKIDPWIGLATALAYGFSSYFIIVLEAGHNAKIHAMAYLPGVLAGMIWAYRQKRLFLGTAVFSLFAGLELTARHPQMFYYFLFLAVPYALWELYQAIKEKLLPQFLKSTGLLLIGTVLAIGANLPYLQNTYTFGKQTIRGKSELTSNKENKTDGLDRDYVTSWSYGIDETWTLLIPNFKGGATAALGQNEKALAAVDNRFKQNIAQQNAYFGDQPFTSGPVYAGAVVFLLAVIGLFFAKGSLKYLLLFSALLTTALAWGKNLEGLTNFFLDNFPLYNKFRAVASMMVVPELIIPILAALGLAALSKLDRKDWKESAGGLLKNLDRAKMLYLGTGLVLAFLAINYLAPGTFNEFLSAQEAETLPAALSNAGFSNTQAQAFLDSLTGARQAIFKADVGRSFLFVLLGAGLLILFQRGTVKAKQLSWGMALLILLDLFPVNKRYLNSENFVDREETKGNYGQEPSPADRQIMAQYAQDPFFRTLNLTVSTFNDATTSFFHYSLGGYHGAKLKIYQELIENQLSGEIDALKASLQNRSFTPASFAQYPAMNMLNTRYVILNPQGAPLENPSRLGNAWLVNQYQEVASADEEIAALDGLNPATTAILREQEAAKVGKLPNNAGQGSIKLSDYDPERMVYQYDSQTENLALFSDIWYPEHWVATIDGEEQEIVRANYVLRALKVPAGKHEIVFEYKDSASSTANTLALISSLLILLGSISLIVLDLRKKETA